MMRDYCKQNDIEQKLSILGIHTIKRFHQYRYTNIVLIVSNNKTK